MPYLLIVTIKKDFFKDLTHFPYPYPYFAATFSLPSVLTLKFQKAPHIEYTIFTL